jgi:trehalose 6-phosphate synthase/phosphatase
LRSSNSLRTGAPGSFVEQKEYSLVWHYRRVEPEFGTWLAGQLTALLDGLLAEADARPVMGRKIVEVRPVWAQGRLRRAIGAVPRWHRFSLAAGDDTTDEDLFEKPDPGPSLSE